MVVLPLEELTPHILHRVYEVRAILEKLPPQVLKTSPLLAEAYGRSLYKCPIIKCSRFYRGFATRNLRDEHLRSHTRAHKCIVEDCEYLVIGFPTRADLTRHKQLCHCELDEEFTFPKVKRASISQSLKNAIDRDDASAVRDLCAEISVYPINETGFLFRAVKQKSFGAALVLLELLGSDEINHKAKNERTVLHEAVGTVHVDFLKKILSTDVDVNAEDSQKRTPLSIALELGHFEFVKLLLSPADGKPVATTARREKKEWIKAFIWASANGHDDILPVIFSTFMEYWGKDHTFLSTVIADALARAASYNHEFTVKTILEMGREMDLEKYYSDGLKKVSRNGIEAIKFLNGETKGAALADAARNGDSATVMRLLGEGADINYASALAYNALYAAARHGKLSMVHLLLHNRADVNAQCGRDGTENALQAASSEGHIQIMQVLLENGANVNAQNGPYGNALHAASANGHSEVVEILLNKGAHVNAQGGRYGYANALQAASRRGHKQIVQLLLEKGADINAQGGRYGYSNALQAASHRGHNQIVQLLLEKGADVNARSDGDQNALQAASSGGYIRVVQILLENGADVNARGGQFGSALQVASLRGHDQVVQMLLSRGAK